VDRGSLLLLAAWLAGVLVALVVARLLGRWRGSARARRRAARALAGEDGAADLLRRAGYRIVARQAAVCWAPLLDGEPYETLVRADYLVEADGERLVAEVKTGDDAPRLATAATRRQLLEYLVAFDADGVLLVCPEHEARGVIYRVEFPGLGPRRIRAASPAPRATSASRGGRRT
jgi:hypothetical protein